MGVDVLQYSPYRSARNTFNIWVSLKSPKDTRQSFSPEDRPNACVAWQEKMLCLIDASSRYIRGFWGTARPTEDQNNSALTPADR